MDNLNIIKIHLNFQMDKLTTDSERLGNISQFLCFISLTWLLGVSYPDRSDAIYKKMQEAKDRWETLKRKAQERKLGLDQSYNLHRFLADYRELCDWCKSMQVLISSSELAKDVAGAEALLGNIVSLDNI